MVFLIRHAHHHLLGRTLVGRALHVGLSAKGFRQACLLAEHLAKERIVCVQCSPQLRARQTAQPLANALKLPLEVASDLDEADFGDWTGRPFKELESDPSWQRWNTARSSARVPHGESMDRVLDRILRHLMFLNTTRPQGRVAIITHAELIRAVTLHFRGMSPDEFSCIAVDPASVTKLLFDGRCGELVAENEHLLAETA